MVGGDENVGAAELVHDDAHKVFDLSDGVLASRENSSVGGVAGLVHLVMVDVNDLHALHKGGSLRTLHPDNVIVFQGDTGAVCTFQYLVPVSRVRRQSVRGDGKQPACLLGHLQLFVGQQSGHAEFCHGREDAAHAVQRYLALRFPLELLGKLRGHLIAEGVGDDDKDAVVVGLDLGVVEIHLLRHFQNPAILRKILRRRVRPVLSKLTEEPVGVQALHLFHDVLEQIIQQGVGDLQTTLEAEVELPVVAVHTIIVRRVLLPNPMRLHGVEPGGVLQKERLHIGDLQQPFIIAGYAVVPDHRPPLFHGGLDGVHLNDLVADLLHQRRQDALVDAGEHFGVRQVFNGQLRETLR